MASEAQHQANVIKWSQQPSIRRQWPELALLHHIPNGGTRDVVEAKHLKQQGVKSGVPDLCLPVPRGQYHGLYIEMKTESGHTSDEQEWWGERLQAQGYLQNLYPHAFRTGRTGIIVLKNPYRGIADILNGMADGKINYGFGHKREYWVNPGMLEAEAWAQFGRVYFDNDSDAKKMFETLFPNLSRHAMMALKGLI